MCILAPVKPDNVSVRNVTATSFTLTWKKGEVRPGITSYVVKVTAVEPAQSRESSPIQGKQLTLCWSYQFVDMVLVKLRLNIPVNNISAGCYHLSAHLLKWLSGIPQAMGSSATEPAGTMSISAVPIPTPFVFKCVKKTFSLDFIFQSRT